MAARNIPVIEVLIGPGEGTMASAAECLKFAIECLDMAENAERQERRQIQKIAAAWLSLANEKLQFETDAKTTGEIQ
jgi:hypothetical protein